MIEQQADPDDRQVTVRPLVGSSSEDIRQAHQLFSQQWPQLKIPLDDFAGHFQSGLCQALLLKVNSSIAGLLVYSRHFSSDFGGPGHVVSSVQVTSQFQRGGLGRKLMEHFDRLANLGNVFLVVPQHQTDMFESLGFLATPEIRLIDSNEWFSQGLASFPDHCHMPDLQIMTRPVLEAGQASWQSLASVTVITCGFPATGQQQVLLRNGQAGLLMSYTELLSFDCWKGLRLVMLDFCGDCDQLVTEAYLKFRCKLYHCQNATLRELQLQLQFDPNLGDDQPTRENYKRKRLADRLFKLGGGFADSCLTPSWHLLHKRYHE